MNLLESYIDEQLIKSWTIFCEPPATDLRYYGHSILNPLESGHRQFVEVKLSAYAGRKSL